MAKIKLFALGDHEDIEVEFKEVDLVEAEDVKSVLGQVTDGKVVWAKKQVVVKAQKAELGMEVDTRPRCIVDGKVYTFSETKRVVNEKDIENDAVIVENPDGEVYVVKGGKFARTYQEVPGGYITVDGAKKFVTVTEDICFKAPWGEMIYAPKGSKLCIEYMESRDIYSVTNSAFDATYTEVENESADENEAV